MRMRNENTENRTTPLFKLSFFIFINQNYRVFLSTSVTILLIHLFKRRDFFYHCVRLFPICSKFYFKY
jgi:hypothetical protein